MKHQPSRVPAIVFGCLLDGELRIILLPGVGLANGGAPRDVPVKLVPHELRLPNTKLWVQLDEQLRVESVTGRDDE
jgi:hypothetical protein